MAGTTTPIMLIIIGRHTAAVIPLTLISGHVTMIVVAITITIAAIPTSARIIIAADFTISSSTVKVEGWREAVVGGTFKQTIVTEETRSRERVNMHRHSPPRGIHMAEVKFQQTMAGGVGEGVAGTRRCLPGKHGELLVLMMSKQIRCQGCQVSRTTAATQTTPESLNLVQVLKRLKWICDSFFCISMLTKTRKSIGKNKCSIIYFHY